MLYQYLRYFNTRRACKKTASLLYNKMMDNIKHGRERLNYIVEIEAREGKEETAGKTVYVINLTAT